MTARLLDVRDLHVHYGASHVLQGVDVQVDQGEILVVLGRNGAGKTTLVHALMGLVRPSGGSIRLDGAEIAGQRTDRIARAGMGVVPQGRRVFGPLTVQQNLAIAVRRGRSRTWTIDDVYDLFPSLTQRRQARASSLSGGEQQMLAIGRALLSDPKLLLLDEPSDGLAPMIVERVREILEDLRRRGVSMLLVEQNLGLGLALATRVVVIVKGTVAFSGGADELRSDASRLQILLGAASGAVATARPLLPETVTNQGG